LLRAGLRPPLSFGRPGETYLFLTELVAGIIEDGDDLRQRAAAEVLEEAGLTVDPSTVEALGAGMFPSPGSTAERFLFFAVEATRLEEGAPEGDGSPMEEGATCRWMRLDDAIAACVRGEIEDLKTELGLRRLRARLDGAL
jgi:ADP-ribose pyrophosphatase